MNCEVTSVSAVIGNAGFVSRISGRSAFICALAMKSDRKKTVTYKCLVWYSFRSVKKTLKLSLIRDTSCAGSNRHRRPTETTSRKVPVRDILDRLHV